MIKDIIPLFKNKSDLVRRNDDFFSDMYTSMNKAFSDIVKEFGSYELSRKKFDFNPNFDIKETAHGYDIKAELSGMDEKDVEVSLEDNVLRISGEKKEEVSDKKGKNHISERRFGSFERAFTLPTEGDSSKIKASFSKGILSIHVPKTQRAKIHSKKIDIKAE